MRNLSFLNNNISRCVVLIQKSDSNLSLLPNNKSQSNKSLRIGKKQFANSLLYLVSEVGL